MSENMVNSSIIRRKHRVRKMEGKEAGKRIRDIRLKRGYTQTEFAEIIHVDTSTVSRWETGKVPVSIDNIRLICRELRIPESELLPEEPVVKAKEENKHKKTIAVVCIIAICICATALITVFIMKNQYRMVGEPEVIEGAFGDTLLIYAKPVFVYSDESAEVYSHRLFRKFRNNEGLEAIEIVIIPKDAEPGDDTESLNDITMLINEITIEKWGK